MKRIRVSYHKPDGRGCWEEFFNRWRNEVIFCGRQGTAVYPHKLAVELMKVGAVYIESGGFSYLEFERDEDAVMFKLRWS
jgi:hypothetical protein